MPVYEYECPKCGGFEHSQSIHDRPLHKCPKCRRKVERLISASSFQLKGGGWYAHGYQKGGNSDAKSSDAKSPEAKSSDSTSTTGSPKQASSTDKPTDKPVAPSSDSSSS